MNGPRMDLHRDIVDDVRARSSVVVAMTVGADSVSASKAVLVAIARILIDHGMG